jgi:small subunit ribosomal protein S4
MGRSLGPSCKQCRREHTKLFLKGHRCNTAKCSYEKREYPPGQHGQRRSKVTDYGTQLREKQKARRMYGVLERQFRRYFAIASRRGGVTGEVLLRLLEMRLDNAVFRMGFATSRNQARQFVRHGHFEVNGRRVDIPSYQIKAGDNVSVCEKSRQVQPITEAAANAVAHSIPEWMDVDLDKMNGTITKEPSREEMAVPVREQLIVELYSR